VTLQSTNPGASIYFTLDGSLPTSSSLLYSAPFAITSNSVVTASAFQTGFSNSFAASALFTIRPPIYFTTNLGFSNTVFQLQVSGLAGRSYLLEVSTNLVDWSPLSTNTAPVDLFNLSDTNTLNSRQRFYRISELP
jgi:hypothetical protein